MYLNLTFKFYLRKYTVNSYLSYSVIRKYIIQMLSSLLYLPITTEGIMFYYRQTICFLNQSMIYYAPILIDRKKLK